MSAAVPAVSGVALLGGFVAVAKRFPAAAVVPCVLFWGGMAAWAVLS